MHHLRVSQFEAHSQRVDANMPSFSATFLAMGEFVPESHSQLPTKKKKQEFKQISVKFDQCLSQLHTSDSGITGAQGVGSDFVRNSICIFRGSFNISSLSLRPFYFTTSRLHPVLFHA
jgi:hypothetical protein